MLKRTDALGYWAIYDTIRDTYNTAQYMLRANGTDTDPADSIVQLDYLSSGLKLRTNNNGMNNGGSTYIYAAFAETPFKYSRAR